MAKAKGPKRPEKLVVGPFVWTVHWDQESWAVTHDATIFGDEPDALRAYGITDYRICTIYINPNNAETFMRETLLHEVIHACQFVAGVGNKTPIPGEDFVTRVTPILLDTLRRNPELAAYVLHSDWEK